MNMNFKRKLPIPMETKEMYPVTRGGKITAVFVDEPGKCKQIPLAPIDLREKIETVVKA